MQRVPKGSILCGLLILAILAVPNLRAQNTGYLITDYGFNGEFGIAVLNADGSNTYNILPNTQAGAPPGFVGGCNLGRTLTPRTPTTSRDGSLVAFESAAAPDGLHRVFLMNQDGSGVTQVTSTDPAFPTAPDTNPAISPDGTMLAFLSQRTAEGAYQIFSVNVDGSNLTQITFTGNVVGLAWSPDSTQLAYSGYNFPGFSCPFPNEGLKIINADGTGDRFLACSRNGAAPAMDWSPDGTRIGFADAYGLSGRDGLGISQVAPDGTRLIDISPTQLGRTAGGTGGMLDTTAGTFRYSPEGLRLAYEIFDANNGLQGISLISVDGTAKQDAIIDHNYHHIWWQPGSAILAPTTLTLAPNPIIGGPMFKQQLSPVLKDSAGNILSRSAYGYCEGDGRFAASDQLGLVTFSANPAPPTQMVVTNGGLVSNMISAIPQTTDPPVSFYPSVWDFGNQTVATASAAKVFTLTNTGAAVLNISGISVTGANPSDFAIDAGASTCPVAGGAVAVAASCGINVIFTPGAVGVRSAQVTVSDDAARNPHNIALTGSSTP